MIAKIRLVLLGALIILLASTAPAIAAEADVVSTRELLSAPDRWHGLPVMLSGKVTHLEPRVSRRGNSYFTFRLADRSGTVTVFSHGAPPVKDGDRVRVDGTFLKVKRVGKYTFQNQVDASRITLL